MVFFLFQTALESGNLKVGITRPTMMLIIELVQKILALIVYGSSKVSDKTGNLGSLARSFVAYTYKLGA